MEKIKKNSLLVVAILILFENAESQNMLDPNSLDGGKIQAAMLYWDYGSPEYLTIETIYPSQDSINHYWNVTHRSPHLNEKSENGFDYYRINQKNVRPVISHMYHEGFTNYKNIV